MLIDGETGERSCACGDRNCRSAGKHPLTSIVPRGVLDATTDREKIEKWPSSMNVGIATGRGLVVLDIDDRDIAARVIEQITDEVVVRTGKGAHVYKLTSSDMSVAILKSGSGNRLGELRGEGAYVAAPPSLHIDGQYRFTNLSIEEIGSTKDPFEWAKSILARVGVDLESRSGIDAIPGLPGPIPPVAEIPFPVPEDALTLQHLLTGVFQGTTDRSSSLYRLACEVYRAADKAEEQIDTLTTAGIVKHRDDQSYRKYSDRDDRDLRYWEIAARARLDVDRSGGEPPEAARFLWDGDIFYVSRGEDSHVPICNFEPVITEELAILADEHEDPALVWRLQCRKGKRVITLDLQPKQREDTRALKRSLSNLPSDFIVRARRWEDLAEGIQQYSVGRTRRRSAYGLTGWLPDRPDTFLLPQRALSARGIESGINYDNPQADNILRRYGEGMEPPGVHGRESVVSLVRDLISVSLPEIVVPLIAQTFGAALQSKLVSRNLDHTRCIVHAFGRTGSYKTSLVAAIMSVWGDLSRGGMRSWSSTDNALQYALYMSRDLPVVIDDYKASLVRNRNTFTQLVQNYADGTTRERLTVSSGGGLTVQRSAVPRGLMITTGEDVWEDQESLLARTVVVNVDRNSTDLAILTRLQEAAHSGALAQIGADWVQWLSENMERNLRAHERAYAKFRREMTSLHGRSRDNLAQLRTFDRLFAKYIEERFGDNVDYERVSKDAWRVIEANHAHEQQQLADLSPLNQLLDAVRDALNDSANLLGRKTNDPSAGSMRGDTVGYIDDDYVYLTRAGTFGWYRARIARQGGSIPFTWSAVTKEAKDRFGSEVAPMRAGSSVMRLLPIPRAAAFGDDPVAETSTAEEQT